VAFTFVHTADWQLDKPFGTLGGETAALLRDARLAAIDRIATVAGDAGARHVLVAGDVFDSATPPVALLRTVASLLGAHRHIDWHLLPGNHDPHTPRGLWQRFAALGLSPNVHLHLTPTAVDLAPGVVLLPAPLTARATAEDPTRWMDGVATPPGTLRIGFAHGSVRGFGSEGDAAVPIAVERVTSAALAYLALGDWHGTRRITDRIWYSGTPEPDQFPDNEPGHVLVVSIERADTPPRVERVATARYLWRKATLALSDLAPLDRLTAEIASAGTDARNILLSLSLTGELPLTEAARLETGLLTLAGPLRHLSIERSGLGIRARPTDLDSLASPTLRRVTSDLQAIAETDPARADTTRHALALLASTIGAIESSPRLDDDREPAP
jgi:hypothetical protein